MNTAEMGSLHFPARTKVTAQAPDTSARLPRLPLVEHRLAGQSSTAQWAHVWRTMRGGGQAGTDPAVGRARSVRVVFLLVHR